MFLCCARSRTAVWLFGLLLASNTSAIAQQGTAVIAKATEHPLAQTIRYATSHSEYISKNVRDYSCRLIKRERIKGELQAHQFAYMKVRCEHRRDDGSLQPLSVFMQFLAPNTIKDRRVLYIADQNDGKVLVRKGGRLLKTTKLKVDPFGTRSRSESKRPITDIGFDKLIDSLVQQAKADIDRDPTATNTRVSYFSNAMVNKRQCPHSDRPPSAKRRDGIPHHEFVHGRRIASTRSIRSLWLAETRWRGTTSQRRVQLP